MTDRQHLTYRGPPARAWQLVQTLQAEGLEVEWEPPQERRDLSAVAEAAAVELVVFAAGWSSKQVAAAVGRVVRRWREKRRGSLDWREEDGYR